MPSYARLHLLLVHFPIALLVMATLLDWYECWRNRSNGPTVTLFGIGVLSAWLSVATGLLNRNWQVGHGLLDTDELQVLSTRHLWLSVSASIIFTAVFALKYWNKSAPVPRWGYALQAIGFVLLLVATHLGGTLAHGAT
jgi:uncharacterized membrane protein